MNMQRRCLFSDGYNWCFVVQGNPRQRPFKREFIAMNEHKLNTGCCVNSTVSSSLSLGDFISCFSIVTSMSQMKVNITLVEISRIPHNMSTNTAKCTGHFPSHAKRPKYVALRPKNQDRYVMAYCTAETDRLKAFQEVNPTPLNLFNIKNLFFTLPLHDV